MAELIESLKNHDPDNPQIKSLEQRFQKQRTDLDRRIPSKVWVYKQLRNFRAGIEANISTLKRAFGLRRCTWKSWEGFCRYVWSAIVAYNLQVMARNKLAKAES